MKLILENFRKFVNEEEIASIAGQDMPLEALYDDVLDKIILVLNTAYGEDNYNLYKILTDLAEFHARGRISENDDKVSKKISYLMDKEGEDHDRAVAIALSMKDRGELEEGFKSGEKVTHDEYGDGIITHPGTKNTNVAVKFDKDTGRGKNVKVSRASLKKAVKEVVAAVTEAAGVDWKEMFPRPYPSREAMAKFEKSGGRDADETVLAWLKSLTYDQKNFLRKLSAREAAAATVAFYQIDRRFDLHDDDPTFLSGYDTSSSRTPYEAWRFLKSLGADDSFLNEEEDRAARRTTRTRLTNRALEIMEILYPDSTTDEIIFNLRQEDDEGTLLDSLFGFMFPAETKMDQPNEFLMDRVEEWIGTFDDPDDAYLEFRGRSNEDNLESLLSYIETRGMELGKAQFKKALAHGEKSRATDVPAGRSSMPGTPEYSALQALMRADVPAKRRR